jgi:hypothetical protein
MKIHENTDLLKIGFNSETERNAEVNLIHGELKVTLVNDSAKKSKSSIIFSKT